jgi:hypothetical protein
MMQPDLRNELLIAAAEPLLPVEKRLVAWGLGAGLVLLIIFIGVSHYMPPHF